MHAGDTLGLEAHTTGTYVLCVHNAEESCIHPIRVGQDKCLSQIYTWWRLRNWNIVTNYCCKRPKAWIMYKSTYNDWLTVTEQPRTQDNITCNITVKHWWYVTTWSTTHLPCYEHWGSTHTCRSQVAPLQHGLPELHGGALCHHRCQCCGEETPSWEPSTEECWHGHPLQPCGEHSVHPKEVPTAKHMLGIVMWNVLFKLIDESRHVSPHAF